MNARKIILSLVGGLILVCFQNCAPLMGKANHFSSSSPSENAAGTKLMACEPTAKMTENPIHLLSNTEYDNTVRDLLFIPTIPSVTYKFPTFAPGRSFFTNDTATVPLDLTQLKKYWEAAEGLAVEVVASKSSATGGYSKIAACARTVTTVPTTCRDSVIRQLAKRAWRRPLNESANDNEFTQLTQQFSMAANFDDGLQALIRSLLISPNFIFLSFPTTTTAAAPGVNFKLSSHQVAARLSYFIWQTMPDDVLMNLADQGTLLTPSVLSAQVDRMLKDPRSNTMADRLHDEWANLSSFQSISRPELTSSLKTAMTAQSKSLFQSLVSQDRSLSTLVTTDSSGISSELNLHYGSSPRKGVLSLGSFLSVTAGGDDKTHPVKRGNFIASRIFCNDVPPPPPNVTPDPAAMARLPADATPEETLRAHRSNSYCASCHNQMDPYGLSLETFDMTGRWRTRYVAINREIDQVETMPTGEAVNSSTEFLEFVSTNPVVRACLSRQLLSMALARKANSLNDNCVAREVGAMATLDTVKFSDAIKAVVLNKIFLEQRWEQ